MYIQSYETWPKHFVAVYRATWLKKMAWVNVFVLQSILGQMDHVILKSNEAEFEPMNYTSEFYGQWKNVYQNI